MLCSRTISYFSNRSVLVMMSRMFSLNNISHSKLLWHVNSKACVHPNDRKSFQGSIHQHTSFSTGKYSLSARKIGQTLPLKDENEDFRTIYKHPDIRTYAMISKFKSVVYIGTLANIAYSCATFQSPDTSIPMYLLGFSLTVIAAINITIFSQYASRCVGVIRINDETQRLKVSHLNFMGTRKDLYVDTSDIVPLLETSYTDDNKVPLVTKDGTVNLYMSFVKGQVLDHDAFYKLFS